MEIKTINLTKLVQNKGQVEGVPANPRQWSEWEVERLAESMRETPELTEARGCLVVPHEKKYVVIGGNMRLEAARLLEWEEMVCAVYPAETPAEKLKEIAIKDNGKFGSWDMDRLANSFPEEKLTSWGVDIAILKDFDLGGGSDEFNDEEKEKETREPGPERQRIIITFAPDMTETLEELLGFEYNPDKKIIKAESLEEEA